MKPGPRPICAIEVALIALLIVAAFANAWRVLNLDPVARPTSHAR